MAATSSGGTTLSRWQEPGQTRAYHDEEGACTECRPPGQSPQLRNRQSARRVPGWGDESQGNVAGSDRLQPERCDVPDQDEAEESADLTEPIG